MTVGGSQQDRAILHEAPIDPSELRALVTARFEQSIAVPERFFAAESERIAEACLAMARRFYNGGRLLTFGNGAAATDAQHVSVEFIHPVIVGKRALPAIALSNDSASLSARRRTTGSGETQTGAPFMVLLRALARTDDIALGFSPDGRCANVLETLVEARRLGLLTLALVGGDGEAFANAGLDFCFAVPADDAFVVQETHETLYHVLWELVHVFFEHEGLLT